MPCRSVVGRQPDSALPPDRTNMIQFMVAERVRAQRKRELGWKGCFRRAPGSCSLTNRRG